MSKNIWIVVTAGTGPMECGWVVTKVCEALCEYALAQGYESQLVECSPFGGCDVGTGGEPIPSACKSVILEFDRALKTRLLDEWVGTVKWVGQSPYRPRHRRKNWFVGVELVESATAQNRMFDDLDRFVEVETMRSSGPGGQHVNKTESAVRVTHLPTGISLRVDSERSQHRNRAIAFERLKVILIRQQQEGSAQAKQSRRDIHHVLERGNAKRVYVDVGFKPADGRKI